MLLLPLCWWIKITKYIFNLLVSCANQWIRQCCYMRLLLIASKMAIWQNAKLSTFLQLLQCLLRVNVASCTIMYILWTSACCCSRCSWASVKSRVSVSVSGRCGSASNSLPGRWLQAAGRGRSVRPHHCRSMVTVGRRQSRAGSTVLRMSPT